MEFFALSNDFSMMFIRLLINVLVTWFIIDRLYFKKSQRRDFYFTYMLISMAIFFIVFFMIFVLEDMKRPIPTPIEVLPFISSSTNIMKKTMKKMATEMSMNVK